MNGAKTHYRGRNYRSYYNELKNDGVQLQLAKSVGIHDLLTTWTYDKSKYLSFRTKTNQKSVVERDSV